VIAPIALPTTEFKFALEYFVVAKAVEIHYISNTPYLKYDLAVFTEGDHVQYFNYTLITNTEIYGNYQMMFLGLLV